MLNLSRLPEMPTAEQINARSAQLLEEYTEHSRQVTEALERRGAKHDDEGLHEARLYQGWSAQKLAGLQLLAECQAGIIAEILVELNKPRK